MPTFRNYNEFEKFFNSKLQKAMELTRDEVFSILQDKVGDYYTEIPIDGCGYPQYENTDMLKNATEKTSVFKIGDKLMFTVGFKNEYLTYEYPGWKKRWGRGNAGKNGVTGEEVLSEQFNAHMHGNPNFMGRHDYWDEMISEIRSRGGLDGILKRHLIKLGVPIK